MVVVEHFPQSATERARGALPRIGFICRNAWLTCDDFLLYAIVELGRPLAYEAGKMLSRLAKTLYLFLQFTMFFGFPFTKVVTFSAAALRIRHPILRPQGDQNSRRRRDREPRPNLLARYFGDTRNVSYGVLSNRARSGTIFDKVSQEGSP